MSDAPLAPCPRPHCGRLTPGGGLCTRHRGEYDALRGSATARGYDVTWSRASSSWLTRFPWCGQRIDGLFHGEHSQCAARGDRVRARVTDHIVPLREGGARLDPRNLQSLCVACNTRKG